MTIPTQTCVAGFIVSMGTLEQTVKRVHYVRARVGVDAPVNNTVAPGRPAGRIFFFLYVYGDAAERVSRRFRSGDVFVASGRVGYLKHPELLLSTASSDGRFTGPGGQDVIQSPDWP
ncbi:MAG: hypothetical protein ACOH2F_10210 [Cellulomonas sp.]